MAIYDQCKTCRRLGQKLFLKGDRCFSQKCALNRNSNPPGPQRKRRSGTASEYKKSLVEKQALKKWYGISEKQFRNYVLDSLKKMGKVENVADELIKNLEKRLDNVVYRLGFAKSRAQARQIVSHGYFLINNKSVNIPSYQVKRNDEVSLKESKKSKGVFKDINDLKKMDHPVWFSFDKNKLQAKVIGEPNLDEVKPPAEISSVFEFYSR